MSLEQEVELIRQARRDDGWPATRWVKRRHHLHDPKRHRRPMLWACGDHASRPRALGVRFPTPRGRVESLAVGWSNESFM